MTASNRHKLIIIGCGASGMAAAISASVYEKDILILERNPVAGKKITATGNGKCNFTNEQVSMQDLRSGSGNAFPIYRHFDNRDALDFFESLGIPPFNRNGYYYPFSNQAASVRDAFVNRLEELKIPVVYDCRVRSVEKKSGMFRLMCQDTEYTCERLIIAAGGQAQSCFGTDGSFYYICRKLGHSVVEPIPALVGLTSDAPYLKQLAGVRHEATVTLNIDKRTHSREYGEIIFNKAGISGIPVMNASAPALRAMAEGHEIKLSLDFFRDISTDRLTCFLCRHFERSRLSLVRCLTGVLNDKMIGVILKECGVSGEYNDRRNDNYKMFEKLARKMKNFIIPITGSAGFENAQTTSGGIPLYELDADSLESKLCPGLYITGELVDVDGRCGGYNLQWAWTSGVIAGAYAGGGKFDKTKLITP
jgi:predicted Rossmann fold flavoprotein